MNWSHEYTAQDYNTALKVTVEITNYRGNHSRGLDIYDDLRSAILKTLGENIDEPESIQIKELRGRYESVFPNELFTIEAKIYELAMILKRQIKNGIYVKDFENKTIKEWLAGFYRSEGDN